MLPYFTKAGGQWYRVLYFARVVLFLLIVKHLYKFDFAISGNMRPSIEIKLKFYLKHVWQKLTYSTILS